MMIAENPSGPPRVRLVRWSRKLRFRQQLSPDWWQALSPYLDQALAMPEEERAAWLASLCEQNPALAAHLQTLLAEGGQQLPPGFQPYAVFPPTASAASRSRAVRAYLAFAWVEGTNTRSAPTVDRSTACPQPSAMRSSVALRRPRRTQRSSRPISIL